MNSFHIKVRTLEGKEHTLEVNSNDTVLSLKKAVEDLGFGDANSQKLVYSGIQLDNDSTLSENAIEDGAMLTVLKNPKKINVNIKSLKNNYEYSVYESDTVQELSNKLTSDNDDLKSFKLLFLGKELDSNSTFSENSIGDNATVNLVVDEDKFHLYVKSFNGETTRYDQLTGNDSILDLKKTIKIVEGISVDQQRLMWNSKQLTDDIFLSEIGSGANLTLGGRLQGGIIVL